MNFDLYYLVTRGQQLNRGRKYGYFSRRKNHKCRSFQRDFSSKAQGTLSGREMTIPGMMVCDLLVSVRKGYKKYVSYKLDEVAKEELGVGKVDIKAHEINILQEGTDEDRLRLAIYCLVDALRPMQLMYHLRSLVFLIEMCRMTYLQMGPNLYKGVSVRLQSVMFVWADKMGYAVDYLRGPTDYTKKEPPKKRRKTDNINELLKPYHHADSDDDDESFEGARVLEPDIGIHQDLPTVVLDFKSLYPTIIMAYNYCFTTLLDGPVPGAFESPNGNYYAPKEMKQGLLSLILEDLMQQRQVYKQRQRACEMIGDTVGKNAAYISEMTVKILMNAFYGGLGNRKSSLFLVAIAADVTGSGRDLIDISKAETLRKYPDAKVIYGDTVRAYRFFPGTFSISRKFFIFFFF